MTVLLICLTLTGIMAAIYGISWLDSRSKRERGIKGKRRRRIGRKGK